MLCTLRNRLLTASVHSGALGSSRSRIRRSRSGKGAPQIPDLPTMEELGFKGFEATAWFGLMAPAGTPQPILNRLHAETVKVMAMPDVRAKLEGLGLQLVGNSPADFTKALKAEGAQWATIVKSRKLMAN